MIAKRAQQVDEQGVRIERSRRRVTPAMQFRRHSGPIDTVGEQRIASHDRDRFIDVGGCIESMVGMGDLTCGQQP